MFPNGSSPNSANWGTNNGRVNTMYLDGHSRRSDAMELTAPANVTNVLTVTNVNTSNDGTNYVCTQGVVNPVVSSTAFLTVVGK